MFEQTWFPFYQGCIVPSLVEISLAALEKKILKFYQSIFAISLIISPRKKVGPFIWTNLKPLHPRVHCAKFDWYWPNGSGEENIFISSMYICYFIVISPWKRAGPSIWTSLNPHHQRMFCAKFVWNWTSGSWEEVQNRKSLQRDGQRDRWQVIRKAHLSFQIRWANN